MLNAIIFILSISRSLVAISLIVTLMVFTFLILIALQDHLIEYISDFNSRNKCLTTKLLKHGDRYHKFFKFYCRHYESVEKYISLKKLLEQGISNMKFYRDLVYRFKNKSLENLTSLTFQKSVWFMHYAAGCMPSNSPNHDESCAALFSCTAWR